jgi:hypothetical protein
VVDAQAAVEPALQLIVGQALTQQANDKQQLVPMIERVRQQTGQRVQQVLADSGYCSEENLRRAAKKKVDLYVATGKQKHNQPAPGGGRAERTQILHYLRSVCAFDQHGVTW